MEPKTIVSNSEIPPLMGNDKEQTAVVTKTDPGKSPKRVASAGIGRAMSSPTQAHPGSRWLCSLLRNWDIKKDLRPDPSYALMREADMAKGLTRRPGDRPLGRGD